jgi:L-ribulose-5-phosphate 3-epimerase UlaE
MRLIISEQEKKEILSSYILIESVKQAKKYVELGLLSNDILDKLITIDPSKTKKYVGWMSKIWITEKPDLDNLRNTIEEYNTFLNKGKAKTKDINQFKSFKDLYAEVDSINQSGEGTSIKDLENDYETIIDTPDLLIMSPHTHEASRKLGLSKFQFTNTSPKLGSEKIFPCDVRSDDVEL